jgi:uncharacterized membrane protein
LPLDGSPADGGAFLAGLAGSTGQEAVRQPAAGAEAEVEFSPSGSLPAPSADRLMSGTAAARGVRRARPVTRGAGRDPVLWLIAGVVFGAYATISIFRYLRRDPTSWDLGIFTEYVKQFAHLHAPIVDIRGPGFNLLGDHFHPIVAVLAPFFRLAPTPVTLLIAQALLTALSVIPVYRAADQLLSRGAAQAITAAYGLSWGLQQLANYDFHEIAFAVPLLAASLSALIRGRTRAALWWALPLVLVKEDQGLTLAALGLIIAFSYRRRAPGLILAGWGLAWSLLAILVIIPHFNPGHSYGYWLDGGTLQHGLHLSASAVLRQFVTAAPTKLTTTVLVLLVTGFLALRSPLVLAIVPDLVLRFVSTNFQYWGTQWHYNAPLMPIVFIAAIDAMARVRATRDHGSPARPRLEAVAAVLERHGPAVMLTACAALAFQFPLSSLWSPATYQRPVQVRVEDAAMALVPDGVTVDADAEMLAPLAARTDTYWLGNHALNPLTEYIVYDERSADFVPGQPDPRSYLNSRVIASRYQLIFNDDGVGVLKLLRYPRR